MINMMEDIEELFWKRKIEKKQKKIVNIKRKILAYFIAARIPTCFVVIIFLLLGEWYSIQNISFNTTLIMILFLISVQFIHGLTNMVFDKKLDIFSRKLTIWVFKYISSTEMIVSSLIFSLIGLSVLWFLNFSVFILGLILIIITVLYNIPPVRFKTRPPLDSISNMLELGTFPFLLGWLATGNQLNIESIIYGLIMGLPVISYYLLFSWEDIKTDKEFKINTSCTVLGYEWTINVSLIIWIILIIGSVSYLKLDFMTLSFLIITPILALLWLFNYKMENYNIKKDSLDFFIRLASFIWIAFIYVSLSILTTSEVVMLLFFIYIIVNLHAFRIFYYQFYKILKFIKYKNRKLNIAQGETRI